MMYQNNIINQCQKIDHHYQKKNYQFKLFLDHLDLSKETKKIDSNKNININQYCQQKIQLIQQIEPVKFKFELINRIKQDRCFSFTFSIDSSVMVVGQNSMIKVFEFKDGNLKETLQLTEHKDYVRCLYFMKKTLQFVSGCNDNFIMIWSWVNKYVDIVNKSQKDIQIILEEGQQ
ncbi:unnamed protein product [Paramecium primaurelia]|uniref:WD40-repeat-containing domain n=1 Tax=Paramecium primaurelia TaxID=5886 RepID=A0A8S1PIE5_PARPR|nr:unnamed protein product [Paramecium primaurelia]